VITAAELAPIPLFAVLDEPARQRLAQKAADIRVEDGDWVIREGEDPRFFVVLEGLLQVVKDIIRESWLHKRFSLLISDSQRNGPSSSFLPRLKDDKVIGMIDVDAFEKDSWQQTSFIAGGEIQANAHWRHEVDLTHGTGADSHILWWQAGKTSLCFAQITWPLGGLVQYSAFGSIDTWVQNWPITSGIQL
jgi:hypothetical protein